MPSTPSRRAWSSAACTDVGRQVAAHAVEGGGQRAAERGDDPLAVVRRQPARGRDQQDPAGADLLQHLRERRTAPAPKWRRCVYAVCVQVGGLMRPVCPGQRISVSASAPPSTSWKRPPSRRRRRCDRAVVEAADDEAVVAERGADGGVDGDEVAEHHRVGGDGRADGATHAVAERDVARAELGPRAADGRRAATPTRSPMATPSRRRDLRHARLDLRRRRPSGRRAARRSGGSARSGLVTIGRRADRRGQGVGHRLGLGAADVVEAGIGIVVPARGGAAVAHEDAGGHGQSSPASRWLVDARLGALAG